MKHLEAPDGDTQADTEFIHELEVLLRLRHANVLLYLGGSATHKEMFFLTELMDCDLNKMIKSKDPKAFWKNEGRFYILDIIQAIAYIHKKKSGTQRYQNA